MKILGMFLDHLIKVQQRSLFFLWNRCEYNGVIGREDIPGTYKFLAVEHLSKISDKPLESSRSISIGCLHV